jgi:hypothetical protein
MRDLVLIVIILGLISSVAIADSSVPRASGNMGVSPGGDYQNDLAPFAAQTSAVVTDYVIRPEKVGEGKKWWDERVREGEKEKNESGK